MLKAIIVNKKVVIYFFLKYIYILQRKKKMKYIGNVNAKVDIASTVASLDDPKILVPLRARVVIYSLLHTLIRHNFGLSFNKENYDDENLSKKKKRTSETRRYIHIIILHMFINWFHYYNHPLSPFPSSIV